MEESVNGLQLLLKPRCPACGKGKLFGGLLKIAPRCDVCHVSFEGHEQGDGPAFFVITVVGFVVVGLMAWVEFTYTPPYWVHAALWVPLVAGMSIWLLRFFKALIVTVQYRHIGLK